MPTPEYVIRARQEEKLARETLLAQLPAHIITTHFDQSTGLRNTRAGHAALAYIQELEATNTRLQVENGWLIEDNEEIAGKLKETEERLQEWKRRNGVLQKLLEDRMKVCNKQHW